MAKVTIIETSVDALLTKTGHSKQIDYYSFGKTRLVNSLNQSLSMEILNKKTTEKDFC